MSDQWGHQPMPNQPPWSQQPAPNQPPWVQQPISNQPPWSQHPVSNQPPWMQQSPNNSWQPPLNPGQFQPLQPPSKKKRNRLLIILGIVGGALVFACALCGVIGSFSSKTSNTGNVTVTPTAPSTPAKTPAQVEADYKANTTSTTVDEIDKVGRAYQRKDIHFRCKLLNFVKDSTGNTVGANVTGEDSYSSVIQVEFTTGTDLTQLNEGDILEVWGTDEGVFSTTNAFGATIQEVGVTAKYMNDQTTNYHAGG